jgi:O-antigen ligase
MVDFLMPFFAGIIIYKKWYKNWNLLYVKNFLFLMGIIALSIILNNQWLVVNDWFEIYKVIKWLLVFIVFKELFKQKINTTIIDVIFVCLLIFNFLHYHNLFSFNEMVMPLYCGEGSVHLTFFGLNSLGLPGVKRMIGTMGNPNDNAILFLFFMLFYLPEERWKPKNICFFVLCLIAFLACQSRTSLVAFIMIIIANFFIIRIKWVKALAYTSLIIVVMISFFVIDIGNNYSLTLLDGSALESNSWTYRLELWKQFLGQFLNHPIIGHAPQKNYFYEHKLHFENEYILFLWRYGILGFISLIGFYLIPVKQILKTVRSSEISKNTLLLIMIFAICGLANVPLSNTTLSLLFFNYLGVFYSQKYYGT